MKTPARAIDDLIAYLFGVRIVRTSKLDRLADQIVQAERKILVEQIKAYRSERTKGDPKRLENFGYKIWSQSDEDGIIAEIFRRIGETNRVFVEFGVEYGNENNTRALLEHGWSGLWIEGNPHYATIICDTFQKELITGQLRLINSYVNAENINDLIRQSGISGEIDFLSIDIDSIDYHVFKVIEVIKPRLVCMEHNHTFLPGHDWVMPYDTTYRWGHMSSVVDYGASVTANERLARSKRYKLVGCGLYSSNGFYVREDLVDESLFSGPYTAEHFFNPLNFEMIFKFPRGEDVFR